MTSTQKGKKEVKRKGAGTYRFRNLSYYLKEALRSLIRNRIMTLTSVATVAACLLIVIFSFAIVTNVNFVLAYTETSVPVTIWIEEGFTPDQIDVLKQQVTITDNVASVRFVCRHEAWEARIAEMPEDLGEEMLASFDGHNPLRDALELSLHDIRHMRQTVETIEAFYGAASVRDATTLTELLISANNFVGILSAIIILVLGILSVVIITNTVKLTVNSRRNEILIMKYVGATEWFIKWPFVIEGIVIGIIGAAIPIAIAWPSYDNIVQSLSQIEIIGDMPFRLAGDIFPFITPIIVILGAGIGTLGSITSMRRYLSV